MPLDANMFLHLQEQAEGEKAMAKQFERFALLAQDPGLKSGFLENRARHQARFEALQQQMR